MVLLPKIYYNLYWPVSSGGNCISAEIVKIREHISMVLNPESSFLFSDVHPDWSITLMQCAEYQQRCYR